MSKNLKAPKKKITFEERLPLIMSFMIPVLIMLGICAGKGIYPFGSNQFLRTDLYHQYLPFYTELARRLKGGESLTYAFNLGLGGNWLAVMAYYLICPTQILLYVIPESFIIEYTTIMIIIKIGLCGYTMAKYLSVKHNTRGYRIIFFALCYALSGYLAAYSWNVMWLDVIFLAPIVFLGVEKLVKEGKPMLYCISLAAAIISNYYIAMMLCIFLVFYFFAVMIMQPAMSFKDWVKKMLLFGLYSLIAGGISAIIIVPAIYNLYTTFAITSSFPQTMTEFFKVFEMLPRLLINATCETGLEHWPNIFCGVSVLMFIPMYFMNKRVYYKEKIVNLALIAFLTFCFAFNIPEYIWHGFHTPNSLPARQSFIFVFLLISMSFEGYKGFDDLSLTKMLGCGGGAIALVLLLQQVVGTNEKIEFHVYLVSIIFLALYLLFMYLQKAGHIKKFTAYACMIAVLIVELGINTAVTSVSISNRDNYISDKADSQIMLSALEESGFYRVEKTDLRTNNDGIWIDYNSASTFSSTTSDAVSKLYKKLGMESSVNSYAFKGATPFVSSLLSVRYMLSQKDLPESPLYKQINQSGTTRLYENLYTLPLGYMIPADTNELWAYSSVNGAKSLNSLANIICEGGCDLLHSIPGTTNGSEFTSTVNSHSHVYVYVDSNSIKNVSAAAGENSFSFSNVNRHYLLDMGIVEAGTDISLTTSDQNATLTATAYTFDDDAFIKLYDQLNEQAFNVTAMENSLIRTYLSGKVTAKQDGALLLTVPYDTGWTVKVDGIVTKYTALADALITIPLSAGEHTIEMAYLPDGFVLGAIISAAALFLLLICIIVILIRMRINKNRQPEEEASIEEYFDDIPDIEEAAQPDAQEITDLDELTLDAAIAKSEALNEKEPEAVAAANDPAPAAKEEEAPVHEKFSGWETVSDEKPLDVITVINEKTSSTLQDIIEDLPEE